MSALAQTKRGDVYDTLEAIDKGSVTKELAAAMREATMASINTMKKSEVIIKITIDPDTKTEPLAMRVSANIAIKKPATPRKAGIFYPTAIGGLTREHPHQQRDIEDAVNDRQLTDQGGNRSMTPRGDIIDSTTGEVLQEGGGVG